MAEPPGHRATGSPGRRVAGATGRPGHRATGPPQRRRSEPPGRRVAGAREFVRAELSSKVRLILDAVKERVEYKRLHDQGERSGKDA
ncbi:hypothetical protein ACFZCL_34575 [Streptomyces sp. NPDC008159]|uniref:hypothetical protein n=1 Tax=Streptomyces sp. NPDC008159 TaxID=3364817 RepID=UPI0036EFC847